MLKAASHRIPVIELRRMPMTYYAVIKITIIIRYAITHYVAAADSY